MKRPQLVSLLLLALASCASQSAPCVPDPESRPAIQADLPPLPHTRHGHCAHLVGDTIIVLGGFDDDSTKDNRGDNETWLLNLNQRAWRCAADMPAGRAFFGSAAVDGLIYTLGDSIDRYDVDRDRWDTMLPAGQFPRSHFSVAALGRRIYCFGGYPEDRGHFKAFDLGTAEVIPLPNPPGYTPGNHFHILAALAGKLHVVGGLHVKEFQPTTEHWIFDGPPANTWSAAAAPPFALWAKFSIIAVHDDSLFVFEGDRGCRYDARSDSWSTLPGPGEIVVMPTAIVLDGRIHVIGGETLDTRSTTIESFDLTRSEWSFRGKPAP
jgi:hypothetical protein